MFVGEGSSFDIVPNIKWSSAFEGRSNESTLSGIPSLSHSEGVLLSPLAVTSSSLSWIDSAVDNCSSDPRSPPLLIPQIYQVIRTEHSPAAADGTHYLVAALWHNSGSSMPP